MQKLFLSSLILWFFLFADKAEGQEPFVCQGQFFTTYSAQINSPSTLIELSINPVTGDIEFIPISNLNVNINAIGFRSTDRLIYGIDPAEFLLYRIDANGSLENLGQLTDIPVGMTSYAGDITPDGKYLVLYGIFQDGSSPPEIILVDLESDAFAITRKPVLGSSPIIFDLAFDPIDSTLYGVNSNGSNYLVTLNPASGEVLRSFPPDAGVRNVGGLFFDAFGSLYAYGTPTNLQGENAIFRIKKESGVFTYLGRGPQAQGNDACSCPYHLEMHKTVVPEVTIPCSTIEYRFEISNQSGNELSNISINDYLPDGFVFLNVKQNPFGGIIRYSSDRRVQIDEMVIPQGRNTMVIEVGIGDVPPGKYANQAVLIGLPAALGDTTFSDDPSTFISSDSTVILVEQFELPAYPSQIDLCMNASPIIDLTTPYEATYQWSEGSTTSSIQIFEPGSFRVTVTTPCDTLIRFFEATKSEISASFSPKRVDLVLGDSYILTPVIINEGVFVQYKWQQPDKTELSCSDCENISIIPPGNSHYSLIVVNEFGCSDTAEISFHTRRSLYFPNAFSPNQDGVNDYFFPLGKGISMMTFKVYNRWGGVVYDFDGAYPPDPLAFGWKGDANGQMMPTDVYTWSCQLIFIDDSLSQYKGQVTLLR